MNGKKLFKQYSPCKVKTLKSTNHKLKKSINNNTKITLERHTIIKT